MDSDQLRLILLVLGVALVVGIYLWDRYKRSRRHGPPIKMARNLKEPDFDIPEIDDDVSEVRVISPRRSENAKGAAQEPYIDQAQETQPDAPSLRAESFSADERGPVGVRDDEPKDGVEIPVLSKESELQSSTEPQPASLSELGLNLDEPSETKTKVEPALLDSGMKADKESQFALDLEFNAHGDSDYLSLDPALLGEVPRVIVQINVMNKGAPFTAEQIQYAAAQVDLKHGEMSIYHRETDAGQVLFSMASVVEPGTFPKGKDPDFSTPGMTLFTQLPGARDGLAIYADMLFTAERLSALLDAVLQDERRHKLTKQSIEHTRETILEHRRQIQLLRSRH